MDKNEVSTFTYLLKFYVLKVTVYFTTIGCKKTIHPIIIMYQLSIHLLRDCLHFLKYCHPVELFIGDIVMNIICLTTTFTQNLKDLYTFHMILDLWPTKFRVCRCLGHLSRLSSRRDSANLFYINKGRDPYDENNIKIAWTWDLDLSWQFCLKFDMKILTHY